MTHTRPRSRPIAWMRALHDRYQRACEHHPTVGPLERHQHLERKNADYWQRRLDEATP